MFCITCFVLLYSCHIYLLLGDDRKIGNYNRLLQIRYKSKHVVYDRIKKVTIGYCRIEKMNNKEFLGNIIGYIVDDFVQNLIELF